MPKQNIIFPELGRDGTSQADRMLAALDPDYVSVDERSLKDLLLFAREYGKELKYFNARNQEAGDWSAFIDDDLDLDEVVSFVNDSDKFTASKKQSFSRPHFVLFLSFLKLLQKAQQQLNHLTQRHLDFYYQEVLRMKKKAGVPDQVNLLFKARNKVDQVMVPAGTRLNAGPDATSIDRYYQTDRDIVVSQAKIEKLSTLYAEKQITGIRSARESKKGTLEERFMRMLEIALGHPLPGDALPLNQTLSGTKEPLDSPSVSALGKLVSFSEKGLFMPLFDLRALMKLKRQRDQSDSEWQVINEKLLIAAQKKGNPAFVLPLAEPKHFDTNLVAALEGVPDYRGITEVENIDHLYNQRNRQEVRDFIRDKLYFENLDDFVTMMQIKTKIDKEWNGINQILEEAGKTKRSELGYRLSPANPSDFEANINEAIGPLNRPLINRFQDIDDYFKAIEQIEHSFFMRAEKFLYLVNVGEKEQATTWEWKKVDEILLDAYRQKVYETRRNTLESVRKEDGFTFMLHLALGEDPTTSESKPLGRLKSSVKKEKDFFFLEEIAQRENKGIVSDADWQRVYRIVEVAQRFYEAFVPPQPLEETWINLYPAENATIVRPERSLLEQQAHPPWSTFGQAQKETNRETPPKSVFGWAISSPLLMLSEGLRTVTLNLEFQEEGFVYDKIAPTFPERIEKALSGVAPFQIEVSTEKGWISPETLEISLSRDSASLQFKLNFSEGADPIAACSEGGSPGSWPTLRIMLRQIWDEGRKQFVTRYTPFKDLILLKAHVRVDVSGLSSLHLQNDETTLDAKKPFEPFSGNALIGSRFYLAHPELLQKRLDRLDFKLEWMGAPKDIKSHYKNYGIDAKLPFSAKISLIDHRVERSLNGKVNLFKSMTSADTVHEIKIPSSGETEKGQNLSDILSTPGGFQYERDLNGNLEGEPSSWGRYFQWELNDPDFQQSTYTRVAAQKSLELATDISNKTPSTLPITPSDYQVNPPYAPKIKKLRVSYSASVEIVLKDKRNQDDQIFHLHPFGQSEVRVHGIEKGAFFLPQYRFEGELYIGIKAVSAPQNLAILFQMAEGSADPDLIPEPIQWSVLSGNRWLDLQDGHIRSDTSRGLINSGIVVFSLPKVLPNTQLPAELYWVRAAIPRHTKSVCDTVAIHTQAVSATFLDRSNDPDHLDQPLEAESISDLVIPLPEIDTVEQPYTSFGGKLAEADTFFYTRVSERLRHKQRAVTFWDYERLVLDRFPQIYKAKCIPANLSADLDNLGRVEIVVIPDIRNKLPFNPFEPKAPTDLIAEIAAYLADKHSPYAKINIKNAHYVSVKVRFGVRFKAGIDERYHKKILNEELNRFLSPWAYEEGADIVIGGKIYANSIVNFLDRRPYVDYVVEIKLFSSTDGVNFKLALPLEAEGYFVTTDRPDGVLVAAQQHEIDLISEEGYEDQSFTGLNYMKLELDFIVG